MSDPPIHIQLGPSKLALGLILPISDEIGLESHLIGRVGESCKAGFGVSFAPSGPLGLYDLASFEGPATLAEVNPRIEAALASRPMLITATLRDGICERIDFMRELLSARLSGAETVFIACENSPDPLYEQLREEFGSLDIQFLDTVVNRICPKYLDSIDGRRVVLAHELGEWLIERPPRATSLSRLLEQSEYVFFHERDDLRAREMRKRWLVNGGQLLLAILAHEAEEESLLEAANTPGLRDPVDHFHAESIRVLRALHPGLSDNLNYAIGHCVAFCEVVDDVPRMVDMRRADLSPFFENVRKRIGEPAKLAAERLEAYNPEVFLLALAAIDALLEEERAYDWSDPDNPHHGAQLSPEVDAAAVQTYGRMLEGWIPDDEIQNRRKRLTILLRSHRNQETPLQNRLHPA